VEQVSSLKTSTKYKKTPIGEIPVDWEVGTFSSIADINPKRNLERGEIYPFVEMAAITPDSHRIHSSRHRKYTGSGSKFKNRDTIFARITPCTENGKTAYVDILKEGQYGHGSTEFIILGPKSNTDSKFIYYCAKWDGIRSIAVSKMEGTSGRQRVPNRVFTEDIFVPIPPLPEQKRIAEILTTLDVTIEKTAQIIEKTKEAKKGLMQELLTRGIGHKKFKKTEIGEIPEVWGIVKTQNIALETKNAIKAGPFGSELKKSMFVKNGYKVYGQEQVISNDFSVGNYYISEEKFNKLKDFEIKPNDVLISLVGTFGKISVVPDKVEKGIINPRLIKISPNTKKMLSKFLKYLLTSDLLQRQMSQYTHGGTMGILNAKIIKDLCFPVPPIPEQNAITMILQEIDAEIEKETIYKKYLEDSKKGLMQVLLTGKIRVTM
jgi:type I restriction enzyme, S subunit